MSFKQLVRVSTPRTGHKQRDVVLSPDCGNAGFFGVMCEHGADAIYRTSTLAKLPLEFAASVTGMAFRPTAATAVNSERSPEVAIAYGDARPWIDLFDLASCEPLVRIRFAPVQSVAYNQQGNMLAGGTTRGTVVVWALSPRGTRTELFYVNVSRSCIVRLVFNGHGNTVFALTARGETFMIDAFTGEFHRYQVMGSPQDADGFDCWAHDGHRHQPVVAFAGSRDDREVRCLVTVVEIDRGKHFSFATRNVRYVRRLKFHGEKQLIVIGDAGTELWNLNPVRRVSLKQSGVKLDTELNALTVGDTIMVVGQEAVQTVPLRPNPSSDKTDGPDRSVSWRHDDNSASSGRGSA